MPTVSVHVTRDPAQHRPLMNQLRFLFFNEYHQQKQYGQKGQVGEKQASPTLVPFPVASKNNSTSPSSVAQAGWI